MDDKKIIIFSPFYPPSIGGLQSHAEEFNNHLSKKNYEITVFTPKIQPEAKECEITSNNIKIIRFPIFDIIPNYHIPRFWTVRFWKLYSSLYQENYSLVISRMRLFNTSLLAMIYSKLKNKKWIHIEHGSDFAQLNSKITSKIAKFYDHTLGNLVLTMADCVIANSKATAKFVSKISHIPIHEIDVIYRGIEIEKINSIKPNKRIRDIYHGYTLIVFIGRLVHGKGVSDLIKAIHQLPQDNVQCLIIGDGLQKKSLEKLSKNLNISEKITFLGEKTHDETISILKICDIFVNPSHTEGMPTTVIEALLCKKNIIATNVGGTPEIIIHKKNGYLFNPKDVTKLSFLLKKIIDKQKTKDTTNFCKNCNLFSWNENILKYIKIINKLSK